MDGRTDGWTDERTDRKSPHSTGLRPLLGPLPKKKKKAKVKFFSSPMNNLEEMNRYLVGQVLEKQGCNPAYSCLESLICN